jgi:hypothetical protein
MTNETIPIDVPTKVYLDLAFHLRQHGDMRNPDEIVALALRTWMTKRDGGAASSGGTAGRGYQWKELFLPDGTELRMRYHGTSYYAKVTRDLLIYEGQRVSPREWGILVTGGVRNAWRDIWIRRNTTECWIRASMCRATGERNPLIPGLERRRHARRSTD